MDVDKIKAGLEKTQAQALNHLANLRAEIERINDELHWLDHAPLGLEDAQAAIDRFIDAHAGPTDTVKQFFYPRGLNGPRPLEAKVTLDRDTAIVTGHTVIASGTAELADILVPLLGPSTIRRLLSDMAKCIADSI